MIVHCFASNSSFDFEYITPCFEKPMQCQFFSIIERLVGVLSGFKWDELEEDTQLEILELLRKNNKAVLDMSSVSKKSKEQLAEARQKIVDIGEIRKWLNEQETGDSFKIVDNAYKIRVKKSSIVTFPGWAIDTKLLDDTDPRTGMIFYRSGRWILRRKVDDNFYEGGEVNVYRINSVRELQEILQSNKLSTERFNMGEMDYLGDLRGALTLNHFDEESRDTMINKHIYKWLVSRFISSMNTVSYDKSFSFFQIDECNWEFYMMSYYEGTSLRGTIVFKADSKMDIWYEWREPASKRFGYIENISQDKVKKIETWPIRNWGKDKSEWLYYVQC